MALFVTVASSAATVSSAPSQGTLIDTPYFSQTPLLCGGAALAMVLRYWGAREVVPQDFAQLVDETAGGIAASQLTAAARERGVQAIASIAPDLAPIDTLAAHVAQGRPVIALIEHQPGIFHYVVVVGVTPASVVMHDPARAPYEVVHRDEFDRQWRGSSRWMLLVLPGSNIEAATAVTAATRPGSAGAAPPAEPDRPAASPCDALVAQGVAAASDDAATAERVLHSAVALCPDQGSGYRELAGLRLVERRWNESITFAEQAVARAPGDAHAWQLLATGRFVTGDRDGALRAWNAVGEPIIDTVAVEGLRRTPQPFVTAMAGVEPGQWLTVARLTRASRRLETFPTSTRATLSYTPLPDRRVSLVALVRERDLLPSDLIGWSSVAINALVTKEVAVDVASPLGQGDLWQPAFRWPHARRRAGIGLSMPVPGGRPGVLRFSGFVDRQTYAGAGDPSERTEQDRRRFAGSYADWFTARVRLEIGAALDRFDQSRFLSVLTAATTRFGGDRFAARLGAEYWFPRRGAPGRHFSTIDASLDWRSAVADGAARWTARIGASSASTHAPLALWPGAGDTLERTALLRARQLVQSNILAGDVFGRRLAFASIERHQPVWRSPYGALSVAGFVDAARAWHRLEDPGGARFEVDAGAGLRATRPGDGTQLRLDLGVGLRDGSLRVSAGYVTAWGR